MATPNFDTTIEGSLPVVQQNGLNTTKSINATGTTNSFTGTTTFGNPVITGAAAPIAVNATSTLTGAQAASGYITSTSGSATIIGFPTGTDLATALSATQGTTFDMFVDNTAGANTVTMRANTGAILSDAANTTAASFGQLTVAAGTRGIGRFTFVFATSTSYVITRTA